MAAAAEAAAATAANDNNGKKSGSKNGSKNGSNPIESDHVTTISGAIQVQCASFNLTWKKTVKKARIS
jgi:hypothetical protein